MFRPLRAITLLLAGLLVGTAVHTGRDTTNIAEAIDSETARPASAAVRSWLVGIELRSDAGEQTGERTCTGALIGERHVLTAAHCVETEELGHLLVTDSNGGRHGVSGVVRHPKFLSGEIAATAGLHDIAVLEIETALTAPYPKLAGSGRTRPGTGRGTIHGYAGTKPVSADLLPADRTARSVYTIFAPKEEIAFNSTRTTTCFGDSGAPLTRRTRDGRSVVLAGVLSYGPADCRRGIPVVFTRVERNRSFITAASRELEERDHELRWSTGFGDGNVTGMELTSRPGETTLRINGDVQSLTLRVQGIDGALRDASACVTGEVADAEGVTLTIERGCLRPSADSVSIQVAAYDMNGRASGMALLYETRP